MDKDKSLEWYYYNKIKNKLLAIYYGANGNAVDKCRHRVVKNELTYKSSLSFPFNRDAFC